MNIRLTDWYIYIYIYIYIRLLFKYRQFWLHWWDYFEHLFSENNCMGAFQWVARVCVAICSFFMFSYRWNTCPSLCNWLCQITASSVTVPPSGWSNGSSFGGVRSWISMRSLVLQVFHRDRWGIPHGQIYNVTIYQVLYSLWEYLLSVCLMLCVFR